MKWLWVVLVAMPTTIAAQTYTACPTPSTKILSVSAGGIVATSKITVVDRPAPTPFIDERYGYADVKSFVSSEHTGTVYGDHNNFQLEDECGALRYIINPNLCQTYYSGYDLEFPTAVDQIYVEIWARASSVGFPQPPTTDTTACVREQEPPLQKNGFSFLLGRTLDNNTGGFGVTFGTEYPYYLEFGNALMRFDGKWHRYKFWFNTVTGDYINKAELSVWVDDEHFKSFPIQNTPTDQLLGVSLGRFFWHQPTKPQYVDFGRVTVWTSNPCYAGCIR